MRAFSLIFLLLPLLGSPSLQAASMSLDRNDCATILERWANDPKSVPKRVVDQCKDVMAGAAAVPPPAALATAAPVDPCAGPGAADSVLCWGPWSALAPAAAGPTLAAVAPPQDIDEYDPRPELAEPFEPELEPGESTPPLPLGSCAPGGSCGFATVIEGIRSDLAEEGANAEVTRFDMATDGSQFAVDPGGSGAIESVAGMATSYLDREDGYENLFANGKAGDEQSALRARASRGEDGQIQSAADYWVNGNAATRTGNNGHFAWGIATSQAGLNALNGQGVSVSVTGPMSVDNQTTASMVLNFGTQAKWTGSWTNPGYSFSAGGPISGVDLISADNQFSANVQAGSVVQGAVLGEPGRQSVAHMIDVTLTEKGRVRDVGLLRQAAR
jgi:hypothetical protein